MNTWPQKNLMTMTSDVRNKTLKHVLYLVKTNLRSLPKRMNTWPQKNLMTMTSEVKMMPRLRPDQKHLYCTRGAGNFDLCLLCPNWTKTSALWLLRLMAASIGFYSVKSWLRHNDAWNALEVHTASEIHTPLGIRENARSWLFDWSKPTDGATKLGQTPRTHCGVMASKKCEWCHSLRLVSWVAWQ